MTPRVAVATQETLAVRELMPKDLIMGSGFYETLSSLTEAPVIPLEKGLEILNDFRQTGKKVFVVVDPEHGIISTVTLMVEAKFIHGGKSVAHIEDVVTRKGWEHNGEATKLMIRALEEAVSQGCYKAILDCSPENVPFYEKLDFQKCEIQMRRDL